MKFECKDLERCLEVPELMADAREHARDCPVCRRELWIWSEMSNVAVSPSTANRYSGMAGSSTSWTSCFQPRTWKPTALAIIICSAM